ncbi:NDP-sugar epimerase, includes UDP-GlcNAc-inverting 4,6-dehydratase FlaA1 and capsular polysaccharide biosynthesis protein EpsC [Marinitoga hydrogenitolerans DSM 16785]|uniref:NDP-sugar epimerase, includes UDP-GlcNAc-inverting 4,6-dehydratase FlaA1 and capsular polysaccharide biosynthesis protein EpsC n=1 Tax=Marinitoga hydrogenitolerans (strain DSM 16785 / JCM 12826 / AT1271) TaxID=1122195 RepID=A0A1M5AL59_MARH1|nr:nucleoside-diphosphate sugar epimerase/dehydratase [Marinitoga hydrogenitolerans]SHF31001.1 NDP-sugar epimerase, includes UDP-GlcNAc-inverting 4,6-dehydratase FlaA1 and capsular polysaccharide biosynthesis protein EpsC [Marinitoga hydrogenitolerans DSM 16785]
MKRKIELMIIDYIIFVLSYFIALFFRFQLDFIEMGKYVYPVIIFPFIMVLSMYYNKIYDHIWRFATLKEIKTIIYSSFLGYLLNFLIIEGLRRIWFSDFIIPITVGFMTALLGAILIIFSRVWWFSKNKKVVEENVSEDKNVLIIGAGEAGVELLDEFLRHPSFGKVIGFLDDDESKIGRKIRNIKILGKTSEVMRFVEEFKVNEVIIAIPSATSEQLKNIIDKIDTKKVRLKTLPGIFEILNNKISLGFLRDVNIEDLLGRKEIKVNFDEIKYYITNKKILVTGAGGSIGAEICRQIAALNPKELMLLGRGENSIFHISKEIKERFPDLNIIEIIGDVTNEFRMDHIFKKFSPDVVFHAAAHKHVPLMEKNPSEAFRVNSYGTYILAKKSIENNVKHFIYISTDKAINPTSIMGTSKRFGEIIIRSLAQNTKTKFGIVRFGNVLGSRGSVVPIFKEQIRKGGPVTVTDPKMKRYFMTIPEAVALVLQAGAFANNGEVFVLNMGEPVLINKLAREMIRLSGYIPDQDIKVVYTGIRPGEKLYEELFLNSEEFLKTENDRIFMLKTNNILNSKDLESLIEKIINVFKSNNFELIDNLINKYIPEAVSEVKKDIAY